jgi:hypothetical protein
MAIVKRLSSKASVRKIEIYLKQEAKTEYDLISGMNCDCEHFAKECQATNLLYNKNQRDNDRKYYHIIQSFSPKDNINLTPKMAHDIGREFADKNFAGYEVLIVTHTDKEHIHNHFVINSVSIEHGKKYRADNKSLWKMRKESNELCIINGLTNSIQSLNHRADEKFSNGEIRGRETWQEILKTQIKDTCQIAKSLDEFRGILIGKYCVETQLREKRSKHFTNGKKEIIEYKPQGNRKYFDGELRLGAYFGKENIIELTRRNYEKARTETSKVERAEQHRKSDGIGHRTENFRNGEREGRRNISELEQTFRDSQMERLSGELNRGIEESKRVEQEFTGTRKGEQLPKGRNNSKGSRDSYD